MKQYRQMDIARCPEYDKYPPVPFPMPDEKEKNNQTVVLSDVEPNG
jgi:hypothetical protein